MSGWQVGGSAAYNAAKAAEIMYARSLAKELGPFGIRANAVSPGSIMFPGGGWERRQERDPDTIADFIARDMPLGRFGTPEEIAVNVTPSSPPTAPASSPARMSRWMAAS